MRHGTFKSSRNPLSLVCLCQKLMAQSITLHSYAAFERPEFYAIKDHNYEPLHEISNNVVCATSKGSNQPAHMLSLIRAFANRLNIL